MASQITANIIKNGEPVDILYGRLSQEDDHAGDSNSIVNQRSYLEKYAADNGFQNPVFMADDGYSGTNFDRPAWQDIVTLIEAGLVRTLIVKDMSRLGREYLKVGELTELYFPSKGVRFIAVNDGVDSLVESSSDFNPIRNWANELHAKDTSRKVRSVKRMQAENGERLGGKPPYGYRKRDNDSKRLVPDEETKGVVQRIFKLCAEGKGPNQIARILRDDHVLNPTNQYYQQTGVACTRLDTTRPYNWCGATVANILSNPVYLGHTLNMQSSTLSYKNKQIFHRPPEEQVLVKNTHEAIIDQELWDTVQRVREHKRRPPKHMDAPGLFAGLVYCADCGGYMVLCRTGKMKPERYYFRCSTYGKRGKDACTAHHITEANLNAIVPAGDAFCENKEAPVRCLHQPQEHGTAPQGDDRHPAGAGQNGEAERGAVYSLQAALRGQRAGQDLQRAVSNAVRRLQRRAEAAGRSHPGEAGEAGEAESLRRQRGRLH